MKTKLLLMLFVTAVLSASAGAESVTILNAGFENPVLEDGAYTSDNPDWGAFGVGGEGVWNPESDFFGGEAPEGENIGWCNASGGDASFAQVLTETFDSEAYYILTVEVGNAPYYAWDGYKVQLLAGGTPGDTGDITVGTILAEDDNSLAPADGTFATSTVVYTSGKPNDPAVGLPLQIRLLAKPGADNEMEFDDVKLFILDEGEYDPAPVTATLTLAVSDEANPTPVEDTMTIDVYDNPCQAAIIGLGQEFDPGDFDADCDTDLEDYAVIAEEWLVYNELTEPAEKP